MSTTLGDITVIIPVAPAETEWPNLCRDLTKLPIEAEIILAGPQMPVLAPQILDKMASGRKFHWIVAPHGRAAQLNLGARCASRKYLWFLHADSRLNLKALASLEKSLQQNPDAVHYFDLRFLKDGPPLTHLNMLGAWIRSHVIGLPFGDQGFCISREQFEKTGGFPEDVEYGEDHLFVWKARGLGIDFVCTGQTLKTSARKYRRDGWGPTTLKHGYQTARQALPEILRLVKSRFS